MTDINYIKFKESLTRLEERYNYYLINKDNASFDVEMLESIKESCIQRFEICFDTSWKHLKKYLIDEMGLVDTPASPNPVFRKAEDNKIIVEAAKWIDFNKSRGNTTHDYCGDKAAKTFEIIPSFITEAIALYEIISGEKWSSKK